MFCVTVGLLIARCSIAAATPVTADSQQQTKVSLELKHFFYFSSAISVIVTDAAIWTASVYWPKPFKCHICMNMAGICGFMSFGILKWCDVLHFTDGQ